MYVHFLVSGALRPWAHGLWNSGDFAQHLKHVKEAQELSVERESVSGDISAATAAALWGAADILKGHTSENRLPRQEIQPGFPHSSP